jgi:hypothetical protein
MNEIDLKIRGRLGRAKEILGLTLRADATAETIVESTKLILEVAKMIEREESDTQ